MPQQIDTPCKDCLFALYEDNTQTGCNVNMIQKFRRYDVPILEAYDEDKEFYVIQGKRCLWHRTETWKWAGENPYEQVSAIRNEIEISYQGIVFCDNDFEDTKKTVESLTSQYIAPKHITLIRRPDNPVTGKEMHIWLQKHCKKQDIAWRIQNVTATDLPNGFHIDMVISRHPYQYYFVCNSGCEVPQNLFSSLNQKIVEELYPLTILAPNEAGNGLIVSYILHKIFQGNQDVGMLQKVATHTETPITTVTEICPNFLQ